MQVRTLFLVAVLVLAPFAAAQQQGFGYSTSADAKNWVIHSGAGLAVTMVRASCDIASLQYNGQELQYSAKRTHINSGLGTVSSAIEVLPSGDTIQITCEKTGLTQYYFFRVNENVIYMGTYHTAELPLGELRFLARLSRSTVTTGIAEATLDDTIRAIEATDVFAAADNTTRSKYYSGVPFIYDQIHGVYGPKAGVYFVLSDRAYETSIGGPFYRDINNQCGTANELTFYMNSDHTRTEEYRYGFHGPYALVFTDGPAPSSTDGADFGFFQELDLQGFVPDEERGQVRGELTDPDDVLASGNNASVVVAFKNADAQYWTELQVGELEYTSPLMKPGNYTLTVFKKQLAVATTSVEIRAGDVTTTQAVAIASDGSSPDALWTIGEWDGTPAGFLNADKIHVMHPSDARMDSFEPIEFEIGEDADASFPLVLFRGVNDPLVIVFNLTEAQATASHVLQVGVTLAQNNGRTTVRVNDQWSAPVPATVAVKSRGITRGTTTGNYVVYEYAVPASALAAGENRIALGIASGNTDPSEPFLRASVVFDALEFV